jgi:hypothetical protein
MAADFVQLLRAPQTASGGSATTVITTDVAAVVGERIVIALGWFEAGSSITGVVDSAGNTYAIDIQSYSGVGIAICSAPVTTELPAAGTITVTYSTSAVAWRNLHTFTLSGIASDSAVDTTNATPDDDQNMATTATNSSTEDAIIVGAFAMRKATDVGWVAGGGSTEIAEGHIPNLNFASQYRVLTASGSNNSSGAYSSSDALDGMAAHVIYKGGGGAAPVLVVPPIRRVF